MIFKRCIPPTAAPVNLASLFYGFMGLFGINRQRVFESELKSYFSTDYVFLVSSGKTALTIILKGLAAMDSRVEVVIPAYTCYSLPAAIIRAGLKIRLCDVNPDTLDYNYEKLDKIVSQNTLCVISSNLFGMPSDIDSLRKITNNSGCFLIEDVAQAMGCSYDGKKLGTFGDASFFSLGRGKNITCGSGGIVITSSKKIADSINRHYRELPPEPIKDQVLDLIKTVVMTVFLNPKLYCLPASLPFLELGKTFFYTDFNMNKLSGIKSWMMKGWQARLEYANLIRERNSRIITKTIIGIPYLRIPYLCKSKIDADNICIKSKNSGLGIVGMYPSAISEIREISELFNNNDYEAAISIASRLVTVPTHQLLNDNDIRNIKVSIAEYDMQLIKPANYAA